MRLVSECGDVSCECVAGINHRGGAGLFEFPAEQPGIKALSICAVATTDFEMHYGVSHGISSSFCAENFGIKRVGRTTAVEQRNDIFDGDQGHFCARLD